MKRLLIVDDEKMVRAGLAFMVKKSSVPVEEVIECKNGLEALEILKTKPVDAMFTDIRMPKMTGIELMSRIEGLADKPLVVAISSYDDFSYAVEMMKYGAIDYLVKAIQREKVEAVLQKIEGMLQTKNKKTAAEKDSLRYSLQAYLETEGNEGDWTNIRDWFDSIFGDKQWYAIYAAPYELKEGRLAESSSYAAWESLFSMEVKEGDRLYLAAPDQLDQIRSGEGAGMGVGVSNFHAGFDQLRTASKEARGARAYAYLHQKPLVLYQDLPTQKEAARPFPFQQDFLENVLAGNTQAADQNLGKSLFGLVHERVDAQSVMDGLEEIREPLLRSFSAYKKDPLARSCWSYKSLSDLQEAARAFLAYVQKQVQESYGKNSIEGKIRLAEKYIKENYDKPINMAVVSNYIEMNYSVFSNSFKEHTGSNFVNYLKQVRMEKAKELLEKGDDRIGEIAQAVGYENDKHFTKTFKSFCGVSPTDYRKFRQTKEEKGYVS